MAARTSPVAFGPSRQLWWLRRSLESAPAIGCEKQRYMQRVQAGYLARSKKLPLSSAALAILAVAALLVCLRSYHCGEGLWVPAMLRGLPATIQFRSWCCGAFRGCYPSLVWKYRTLDREL